MTVSVGRSDLVEHVVDEVVDGPAAGVFLIGEPGVGTSHVAHEVVAAVAHQGHRIASLATVDVESGPTVVLVDDVHRSGVGAAAAVHELLVHPQVRLVLASSSRRRTSEAITTLWKDGIVRRVDVPPLDRHESDRLTAELLPGSLDADLLQRLWDETAGLPGHLVTMVRAAQDDGVLAERNGMWSWTGPPPPDGRLARVIDERLAGLGRPGRLVAEIVAVTGPIPLHAVIGLVGVAAVEDAEAHDAVGVVERVRPIALRPRTRLVGDVLVQRLDPDVAVGHVDRLTSVLEDSPPDRLRLTRRRFELTGGGDPDDLLAASFAATEDDPTLAGELAAWVLRHRPSLGAVVALARARRAQSLAQDAELVLGAWWSAALDTRSAAFVAERLCGLAQDLGRLDLALACSEEARAASDDAEWHHTVDAITAHAIVHVDPRAAAERARRALHRTDIRSTARVLATDALASASLYEGLADEALALLDDLGPARHGSIGVVADVVALPSTWATRASALLLSGRLAELRSVTERAVTAHELSLTPLRPSTPEALLALATAQTAVGELDRATTSLERAAATLGDTRQVVLGCSVFGLAAAVQSMRGDRHGCRSAVERLRAIAEERPHLDTVVAALTAAEAWHLAATGDDEAAGVAALHGAATAANRRDRLALTTLAARMDACGSAIVEHLDVDDLTALAGRGGLVGIEARFVAAAVTDIASRPVAFEEVGIEARRLGARVHTAEAFAQAALAHRLAGDEPAFRRCAATAAESRPRGLTTPLFRRLESPSLTDRERTIALAAAEGRSNDEISERLGRSVRTVEWHLRQVYQKLGISGRGDLAAVFGVQSGWETMRR